MTEPSQSADDLTEITDPEALRDMVRMARAAARAEREAQASPARALVLSVRFDPDMRGAQVVVTDPAGDAERERLVVVPIFRAVAEVCKAV